MWGSLLVGVFARPWARRLVGLGLAVLTTALFMINLRRAAERAGRAAERMDQLERTHDIQRQMLDAAARRPADRVALARRLRDGRF